MKTMIFFLSFVLLFTFSSKAQTVITVDNSVGSNAQYSDLQTAIALATAGDIIYVHPSEINYGDITVDKTLHLIGFAHSDPDKATYIAEITFGENASNSSFSSLHITNRFYINGLSTTLTGLIFENNLIEGSMIFKNGGADNVLIRGNVIDQIGGQLANNSKFTNAIISNNIITNKIYVQNYQSIEIKNNLFLYNVVPITNQVSTNGSITIQDNIFYDSSTNTLDVNNSGVIYENCLAYNFGSGNMVALNGSNNFENINPNFVSAADDSFDAGLDDYHLQTGSVAMGNGVAGEDIGIYNSGSFVFNNFGYTNSIPTVKITAITNSVAIDADVEVTIATNSN